MKRIIFILLAMVLTITAYSQTLEFPGESVDLLLERDLKVNTLSEGLHKLGYTEFYSTPEMKYGDRYKKGNDQSESNYNYLVNKVFKVIKCEFIRGHYYRLTLENNEIGVLYFKYNSKYKHNSNLLYLVV